MSSSYATKTAPAPQTASSPGSPQRGGERGERGPAARGMSPSKSNLSETGGSSTRSPGSGRFQREPNPPAYRDDYQDPTSRYRPYEPPSNSFGGGGGGGGYYRGGGEGGYLSRFAGGYDTSYPNNNYNSNNVEEEIGGPEWIRKTSRQRRFTNGTLPHLHVREERALEETKQDSDDQERERVLYELNEQMEDMSGYVGSFVERKEEELASMEAMFDEEGNPIQRYDEDGNPIPFLDEDGYAMNQEDYAAPPTKVTVKIDLKQMHVTEGFMWKKGSGVGLFARTNWKRRYFKFDSSRPVNVYYWRERPMPIAPRGEHESEYNYKLRRDRAINMERRRARGMINLMYASIVVPEHPRVHNNKHIHGEYEFDLVSSNGSRTFTLFCETKEEFDKWIQAFSFVTNILQKARASMQRTKSSIHRLPPAQFDEIKRDTALACTCFGPGLFQAVAGQVAEFTIQAVDKDTGTLADTGGLIFSAVLESRDLHYDLEIRDNGDGTYTASYCPTRIGTYELTVMLEDYDVQGSPFHPRVLPAPVSAPHCLADGAGLFCAVVGAVNQVVIHVRNSFNQIVVAKDIPFEVSVSRPLIMCRPNGEPLAENEPTTRDNGDGTYSMFYVVEAGPELIKKLEEGSHVEAHVEIMLDDRIHTPSFPRSVKGGPFRPVLAATATGAALAAAVRHAALQYGTAGGYGAHQFYSHLLATAPYDAGFAPPSREIAFDNRREEAAPPRQTPNHPSETQQFQGSNQPPPSSSRRTSQRATPSSSYLPRYGERGASNAGSEDRQTSSSTPSVAGDYLPIRRVSPASTGASATVVPSPSLAPLTAQQRVAIEAEREELLRLRRELQQGRARMDEQVGRIAVMGKQVQAESERLATVSRRTAASFDDPSASSSYTSSSSSYRGVPKAGASAGTSRGYAQPPPRESRVSRLPQPVTPLVPRAFDASVTALFNKHAPALRRVFRHYSERDPVDGTDGVRLAGFIKCAADFDISPTFCSRKELKEAFEAAGEGLDSLPFPEFVDALGLVAVNALGKPMFAHLYTTDAARVSVLLVMWGLGDASQLDAVMARDRYSAG